MHYFPICLNIQKKKCVVVGGGKVAARKVSSLLDCGAAVTVISPQVTDQLLLHIEEKALSWIKREYNSGDLQDAFLVIAATDDPRTQKMVFEEAEERKILVNVADVPEKCNFILPATVQRGDFSVSVSTGGKSPAMASKVRKRLETEFGLEYDWAIRILGALRPQVLAKGLPHIENKELFERLLDDNIMEWVKNGDWQAIEQHVMTVLDNFDVQCLAGLKKQYMHERAGSSQQ